MSNEKLKEEIVELMDELKNATEIFKMSDKITESFSGKESSVVLSVSAIVSAKVIFGVTSDKQEAFAVAASHFSKVYEMITMFYDEQEEEAEESTKQ